MKLEQKNLIFQFIEELQSENKGKGEINKREEEIYGELEKLEERNPELKNEISSLTYIISSLYSDIKCTYFEYGIIAKTTKETANLNWIENK